MRCSEPGHRAPVAITRPAGRVAELGSLDVMKFADYIEIIKDSVAHGGYDYFHRSLCEPSHGAKIHLLTEAYFPMVTNVSRRNGQRISLRKEVLYLVCRAGERRVDVCEITDHNVG